MSTEHTYDQSALRLIGLGLKFDLTTFKCRIFVSALGCSSFKDRQERLLHVSTSLRGRGVSCTLFCRRQAHDGSPHALGEVLCASGEKLYLAKKEVAFRVNEEYAVLEVFRLEMRN
jgi:hypothetical protein